MKIIYSLYYFLANFGILLAYPMDKNDTTFDLAAQALKAMEEVQSQINFGNVIQPYVEDITEISLKFSKTLESSMAELSKREADIIEGAGNVNVSVSDCIINVNNTVQFYDRYTESCVTPALTLGMSHLYVGDSEIVAFYNKYLELYSNFYGCMAEHDPTARICAGVVEFTIQEATRWVPAGKAIMLQFERALKQQFYIFSECAENIQSSVQSRLQAEIDNFATCALISINKS